MPQSYFRGLLLLSSLSAGSHTLAAVYSGDANFTGTTSAALTQTIEDFQFAVNGGTGTVLSATVQPGGVASYQLQIDLIGGSTFASAVSFTLTGLPAGATYTITPPSMGAGSGAQMRLPSGTSGGRGASEVRPASPAVCYVM